MHIVRVLSFAGLSFVFSAQAVLAQNGGDRFEAANGPFGHFRMESRIVTGEPYSAVRTTTYAQTLTNGTTINRTTTTKEARDSSGRVYRETQIASETSPARTVYSVFDPVSRTETNWRSDNKQAVVRQLPNSGERGQWHTTADSSAEPSFHRHGPTPTVEQLGTKTIEGVEATGTRSTITFPAGAFGNDQPITVTHERWVATDLGITVSETDTDPRTGVRTIALSSIQRSEPDAALFHAPQGYAVTERTSGPRF